jgi:hypothetical protein
MATKLNSIWFKGDKGWVQIGMPPFFSHLKKEHGLKQEDAQEYLKLVLKDSSLEPDWDQWDGSAEEKKKWKTQFNALKKLVMAHFDYEAEQKKLAEKAKLEKQKEGEKLVLASVAGFKLAETARENALTHLQKIVGKGFEIGVTGMHITKDIGTLTKEKLGKTIAILASDSEVLDKVRASVNWNLGDACNLAEQHFGAEEADELIAQVIQVTGKAKHTIAEARRVARMFPEEKRRAGLTFTHHQEAANYLGQGRITEKQAEKLFDLALDGEVIGSVTTASGKEDAPKKVISNAKFRQMLDAEAKPVADDKRKRGKDKEDKKDPLDGPSVAEQQGAQVSVADLGYLYINAEGVVWKSKTYSDKAAEDHVIIDLTAMVTYNEGVETPIKDLPKVYFPDKEKAPAAAAPAKKGAKKEAAKPAEKKPEPAADAAGDDDIPA